MTAIEDLYEDFEFEALCMGKWGGNILREETNLQLRNFEREWKKFRNGVNYGNDGVFVYFDTNWHHIITAYLIPVLNNIEKDFDKAGVEYISYRKSYQPDTFPPHEDILERGRTLYGLLIKNNIIILK